MPSISTPYAATTSQSNQDISNRSRRQYRDACDLRRRKQILLIDDATVKLLRFAPRGDK